MKKSHQERSAQRASDYKNYPTYETIVRAYDMARRGFLADTIQKATRLPMVQVRDLIERARKS
jgi:hypothetical protein